MFMSYTKAHAISNSKLMKRYILDVDTCRLLKTRISDVSAYVCSLGEK